MASNDVPTGRRMNGAQMFMRREGRRPKTEGRKKAEVRRPKPPSRSDVLKVTVRLKPKGQHRLNPSASRQRRLKRSRRQCTGSGSGMDDQASLTRRSPTGGPYPWAEAPRLPSLHRYAMSIGKADRKST